FFQDIKKKLDDLIEKEANAEEVNNSISQIEGSIAEKRNLAKGIEMSLSVSILSKNKDQVDQELEHFNENSRQMVEKKTKLEAKSVTLETEYTRLQNDQQKISADVAKINSCTNQINSLIIEQNNLI